MPSRNRGRGGGLTQALDREVYQVVRKIIDSYEQFATEETGHFRPNFAKIYDEIKRSNSSLNRKPKKLLEDSIERVLSTIQQDAGDSESDTMQGEYGDLEQELPVEVAPSNGLNKSIVGKWSTVVSKGSSTPTREPSQPQENKTEKEQGVLVNKRKANGEPLPKRRKATTSAVDRSPSMQYRLADLGGVDHVVQQFEDLLVMPMTQPEIYVLTRVQPPRGILIHGPPGCGKTMIANAVAAELGVNFIPISAPSIVSGMSGESEKALRDYFEEAKKCAPCLMFIDEIDAITPKREGAQREMERRIVAQLLTCMDDLALEKTDGKPVVVLAATNRPDSLDAALRRGGRFDKEINMTVPSQPVREQILRALSRKMALEPNIDFADLAKRTSGFVGADLNDLVSTAGASAIRRLRKTMSSEAEHEIDETKMVLDQLDNDIHPATEPPSNIANPNVSSTLTSFARLVKYSKEHPLHLTSNSDSTSPPVLITSDDFNEALPTIQPSSRREGFTTIPSTTFAQIGSLSSHITELTNTIISPITDPSLYSRLGITPSSGTLLWGPPGNGKTLLAKAVANHSHANFISVKGPELLNKYVGESERAVRQVFNRARSSVPVIIFFDELDALVPRRDGTMSEASARVVNTMLTELDGVGGSREGIYVIGATNRPDMIDPAMLRPGRLETLLFVGLPDAEGRVDILRTLCKTFNNFVFTDEIANIARQCERFSGADLEALQRRAGYRAIERCRAQAKTGAVTGGLIEMGVGVQDFVDAQADVRPSVSVDDMKRYDRLQREWGNTAG